MHLKLLYVFILTILGVQVNAQNSLRNFGDLRLHDGARMGLSTNLVNDGSFEDQSGFTGFYGTDSLWVTGAFKPIFNELEVAVDNSIWLNVPIEIGQALNFVFGDIIEFGKSSASYTSFPTNSAYFGESDMTKVNGFAHMTGKNGFVFPIGDEQQWRPLILNSAQVHDNALAAYFRVNAVGSQWDGQTLTSDMADNIDNLSEQEYWRLQTDLESTVSLSWNERSAIGQLTDNIENIAIIGWHLQNRRWEAISTAERAGNLTDGFLTTAEFVPNEYALLTFGSLTDEGGSVGSIEVIFDPGNYMVSNNQDGINDHLEIENMPFSNDNRMVIYNRWGKKVYEAKNYKNDFDGICNVDGLIIKKGDGLPSGIYFYILTLNDRNLQFQGYMFLTN